MDADEIRRLIKWLQSKVSYHQSGGAIVIEFEEPTTKDFIDEGFDQKTIRLTLKSSWWPGMVTDIKETTDFADPDETSEQIFQYAKDVVKEYVNKRIL